MSKNVIIVSILAVLLLAAAAYLLFGKPSTGAAIVQSSGPTTAAEQTFLNLAAQLNPIEFDTSILGDPRFMLLQDLKTAVVPELRGRTNPFAPLAGVKK